MTVLIFGKGDDLYLPTMKATGNPLTSICHYTHPNYQGCYSQYGFMVPLNYESRSYQSLMDHGNRRRPGHIDVFETTYEYFGITLDGRLEYVTVMTREGILTQVQYDIDPHHNGWWIAFRNLRGGATIHELVGFLSTDPSEDALRLFLYERNQGQTVERYRVTDIVTTLKDYPSSRTERSVKEMIADMTAVLNDVTPEQKRELARLLDDN